MAGAITVLQQPASRGISSTDWSSGFNAAAPTVLVLDEAWLFLDHPAFAAKIREWLKVLRKKCVSVAFATQDVDASAIVATIKEACLMKIYLPNVSALNDDIAAIYRKFGLNYRQLRILQHARPRKDYYLTSPEGNRLFDLGRSRTAALPAPSRRDSRNGQERANADREIR